MTLPRRLRSLLRGAVLAMAGGLLGCATTGPAVNGPPAEPKFWDALARSNVIYVGERHAEAGDHAYEFALLKGLHARGIPFAIGWEMFEARQQSDLTAWQNGKISTAELFRRTDWARRWGKYSPLYERMLTWSRSVGVENYALNAPASLARKLSHGEKLAPDERRLLPAGYRPLPGGLAHFAAQMGAHPGAVDYGRYYRAQTLWDQTMADRVVQFRRQDPSRKLVVLAGKGHVEPPYGIPPYVRQKLPSVRQEILLPGVASPSATR